MDLLTFRKPLGDTPEHILKTVNTYTPVVLEGKVVQSGRINNSSALKSPLDKVNFIMISP